MVAVATVGSLQVTDSKISSAHKDVRRRNTL